MAEDIKNNLYADIEPPVGVIGHEEQALWSKLTPKAREFALASVRAAWASGILLADQVPGGREVLELIKQLWSPSPASSSPDTLARLTEWAAAVACNMGPYRGFGDNIILPRVTWAEFEDIVEKTAIRREPEARKELLAAATAAEPWVRGRAQHELGHWPCRSNHYYSQDLTEADVEAIDAALQQQNVPLTHTGLDCDRSAHVVFVEQYSIVGGPDTSPDSEDRVYGSVVLADGESYVLRRRRGRCAADVARLLRYVEQACGTAHSNVQHTALKHLARYLLTASNHDWRESQTAWVCERTPPIDYVLGRVETYRDPAGVRAEWEGCTFLVDQELSTTLTDLVGRRAEMPWPWGEHYRETTVSAPAYLAVSVLAQVSSGAFIGLNLPNEVDIRSTHGSKNFSMCNLLAFRAAGDDREPVSFVPDADQKAYKDGSGRAMNAHVALHEGLGHAVGRLFLDTDAERDSWLGKPHALTGEPIVREDVFYKSADASYNTQFGTLSSGMEEARAETAAMLLSAAPAVHEAFKITTDEDKASFVRVGTLNMLRSALVGLEHYDTERKVWRQAHCFARWSILAACMKAAPEVVKLVKVDGKFWHNGPNGEREEVEGSRTEIVVSDAMALLPAIADHLNHINHFRSTGDVAAARKYFDELCVLDDATAAVREEVMDRRQARMLYAPPVLMRSDDSIVLSAAPGASPIEQVVRGFVENLRAVE